MTDAEFIQKIHAEIDKRYAEYRAKMKTDDFTYYEGMANALDLFEQFINTLESEKPMYQDGLEEELDKWRHNHFHGKRDNCFAGEYLERTSQLDLASHFAQWGAEHLKKSLKE